MTNMPKLTVLVICLFMAQFVLAQAQSGGFDSSDTGREERSLAKGTPAVRANTGDAELSITKPEGYPAKDIPQDYQGFRIEIIVADSLLAPDHELFFRHGNIMFEPLSGNRFAYTVGDFQDAEAATGFMQQFMLAKYSEARVVGYKAGKRN